MIEWPFPVVNGELTTQAQSLIDAPKEPTKSLYNVVMSDPETEEPPL